MSLLSEIWNQVGGGPDLGNRDDISNPAPVGPACTSYQVHACGSVNSIYTSLLGNDVEVLHISEKNVRPYWTKYHSQLNNKMTCWSTDQL